MARVTVTFFAAILFLGVSSTWGTSEEDPTPTKLAKNLYPKKYQPMDLKKYRDAVTEEPNNNTSTSQPEMTTTKPETTSEAVDPKPEDLTSSEEDILEAMERSKKSATTTFCVEIRPSNPYQKPFQVCEPAAPPPQQHYGYVYKPHVRPQPKPIKYQQPHYVPPQPQYVPPQPQYVPPQPQYVPPQPSYSQPQPQPPPQPQPEYSRPVMVLPHVPVAEPYHVPKPAYKPASSGVYRASGWGANEMGINADEIDSNMEGNARSAYYSSYDGFGDDKTAIYDFHKKKEVSYVPIITHSVSKSKPLKFLKVLKDLKKDKYHFDNDEYYRPMYHPPPSSYGHQESSYGEESGYGQHHKEGSSSSHGLVITCQPSAVGYTGQQSQMELAKHMDLLKNIYSQSEKLYNQQTLSSNPMSEGSGVSGGYVAPGTYRSSGDDPKGVKSGGGWSQADENMRKSGGGWSQADENMRKSGGGWSQADENMRKSGGGWSQADENMRKSGGGWSQADENMRKSGGGWSQADENMRKSGGGWSQADENMRKSGGGGWISDADPTLKTSHHSTGGGYGIDDPTARSGLHSKGGGYQAIDDSALRTHHSKGGGYQQMEETAPRSSKGGGYQPIEDSALRTHHSKGGGYQPIEDSALRTHHSKGGGYQQLDDQVAMSLSSSAGPNPTVGMMSQKEIDTASAFRSAQGFAMQSN